MIRKIISGGQTGVDRSALDFCLKNHIDCGGWCPRGRMAEDGNIPPKYPLKETDEQQAILRTKKNIEEADGTLILFDKQMDEGTIHTLNYALEIKSPLYKIDLSKNYYSLVEMKEWIRKNEIKILNIAGSRERNSPEIYRQSLSFLENLRDLF
jgi:hypothetical protein